MRWPWLVTAACAAVIAVPGCKQRPHDPIPGPRAQMKTQHHPAGIVWFQGSLDEAFSVVRERPRTGGGPSSGPPCLSKPRS